ncbi:MAG: hypothetical protein HYU64_14395 [Armatimonadetes bacterium]|nr:hypothetical protein [Armatimonadota bacterium]
MISPLNGNIKQRQPDSPLLTSRLPMPYRPVAEALEVMDLDETAAAMTGDLTHPLVTALGVVDGIKAISKGIVHIREAGETGDGEKKFHGILRIALGAGSMLPGMPGNIFVGAGGIQAAIEGTRSGQRKMQFAGILQTGVAVGIGAAYFGIGGPIGRIAVLALNAGKLIHHFWYDFKNSSPDASAQDAYDLSKR